ncbi:MAG: tRNA (adenosine(37)-N6)-dimethylallyltransferase MiaA [Paracoccaceae bacterium]
MNLLDSLSREAPILIAGPTACGKSALALELATRDGRVVVNADALQVYDCWRVLTARPSVQEEAAVPHALYGHVGRDQAYSVGHWLRDVAGLLDRPLVIVGGTGLYFAALTEGLAEVPPIPPVVRAEADALREGGGLAALLAGVDAATAARIDHANPARVQRAWEVLKATGRGLASWQDNTGAPLLPLRKVEAIILRPETSWLDARIAGRFSDMLKAGALDEVQAVLPFWDPTAPWARAIGAPDLVAHLRGESALETAKIAAILASRRYAKRQRTWGRSRREGWRAIAVP